MTSSHATVIAEFVDTVWNQGNLADIDRFVHDGYMVDGDCFGIDGVRNNVRSFRHAFPDLRVDMTVSLKMQQGWPRCCNFVGLISANGKVGPRPGKTLTFVRRPSGRWPTESSARERLWRTPSG
ncbi:MAG: ester cyclase [Chloroflexia bacterium]|nr:ester cyclase [Chloroflexia bacterium]